MTIRAEDKEVFDRLQAWLSLREGRRVRQGDAFAMVLTAALENPEGEAARGFDRKRLSSRGRMPESDERR